MEIVDCWMMDGKDRVDDNVGWLSGLVLLFSILVFQSSIIL